MVTVLLDFDSILYKAVYKVVSRAEMRDALEKYGKRNAKEWLKERVMHEGINRCEQIINQTLAHVETLSIEPLGEIELYITTCKNNFRKKVDPTYKADRVRNDYVWLIRDEYMMRGLVKHSNILEADDLIAIRARELGLGKYIIITMDKDLRQIGGYFFNYYTKTKKNDRGIRYKEYKQKNLEYITKSEAQLFFWKQMLIGDRSDNIEGIHGLGEVKSHKLLSGAKNHFIKVARIYLERNQKEKFWKNYKLLKLVNSFDEIPKS